MFISDFQAGHYKRNIKFVKALSNAGILNCAFRRAPANAGHAVDSIVDLLTKIGAERSKTSLSCKGRYQFFLDVLSLSFLGVLGGSEIRVSFEEPKKALDTLEKYYPNASETAEAYFTFTKKVGCGGEAGLGLEQCNDMYKKIININPVTVSCDTIRYLMCASYFNMMDYDKKKACVYGLNLIEQNLPHVKNDKIRKDMIALQKQYKVIFALKNRYMQQ